MYIGKYYGSIMRKRYDDNQHAVGFIHVIDYATIPPTQHHPHFLITCERRGLHNITIGTPVSCNSQELDTRYFSDCALCPSDVQRSARNNLLEHGKGPEIANSQGRSARPRAFALGCEKWF